MAGRPSAALILAFSFASGISTSRLPELLELDELLLEELLLDELLLEELLLAEEELVEEDEVLAEELLLEVELLEDEELELGSGGVESGPPQAPRIKLPRPISSKCLYTESSPIVAVPKSLR